MNTAVKEQRAKEVNKEVVNFMGGTSYEINPIDTLKMVTASSIFGEPQYYRDGEFEEAKALDGTFYVDKAFAKYSILEMDKYKGMKTSQLMEKIIDDALDYDFEAVIAWAQTLRNEYLMRLNPQIIMVRAAMHPKRKEVTEKNPEIFGKTNLAVMKRGDDVISQMTYYLFLTKSKKNLPNILKRSWAKKVASMSRYELYKYRNHGIGIVDVVRVCHATGSNIDELMRTGTIEMPEDNTTWETLRASGKSWDEITDTIRMNHMALLRNLRGIFSEVNNIAKCQKLMTILKEGVLGGKQFPFRYMSAYKQVKNNESVNHRGEISDTLEECLDIACNNLPKLKGKSAFLSDNSGSAWGTCNSEYGSVTVAEIGNLSSVIGAVNSDEGYVYTFGNKLIEHTISKRDGVLGQANAISRNDKKKVGMDTENGIWLFFDKAIHEKIVWDNIFIYSDMQAGHGGLYGRGEDVKRYTEMGCAINGRYIDVAKLIDIYRKEVNPKVNVYCIQTAGYNNVLVPEYGYRTNILYGWTGKEFVYADAMNKFWDAKDSEKK
jgi:hypothetical protein